ncbi:MAG: hypothetical protein NPINA01_23250 [Nitrospinaceae bacterium]|nr:MAG: hypothetical protein NPINA01_23250 [Nitrospinaceae bacterium]
MKLQKIGGPAFLLALITMISIAPIGFAKTSNDKKTFKEVKQETQDLIQALKGYTSDQRDEVVQRTEAALDNLDNRIDALETRINSNWDGMKKATREKARANLKALRKQRIQVAEGYGSLKSSSASAWEHVKDGFSEAYTALQVAWERAESEFESEQ